MGCTTILVGKNASYDGSTLMARNEDSSPGHYSPKKFIVVNPQDQPRLYRSVISKVEIELPDNPLRYTAMPDALGKEGIWAAAGINDCNVAMTATETLTANYRVTAGDPLVKSGIGEEDLVTIVLPYIHSAKEGALRLGSLLEKYGTYERNGIGFQDENEIWWLETIGGHHWMAKRVKDDEYVVVPNQQGLDYFDFVDAYGEKKNYLCSADLIDFIEKNHLDTTMREHNLYEETHFACRGAFGTHTDSDHCYNTPRAWFMERYFNPNTYKWDGLDADFTPESDNLPFSLIPEKKITIDEIKYVLSSYYQGTDYNPYNKRSDASLAGKYRPIGINRNNFVSITQLRPYMPKEIKAIEWIALASNPFNALVPFYSNVSVTPDYLANTSARVTTENFYWASRIIGALADSDFGNCIADVERYQLHALADSQNILNRFDSDYLNNKIENVQKYLEQCNQKIADNIQKATDKLLLVLVDKVSDQMKNGFSRADN
ncbi:MAG: C69 family dipeptidase [Erysipelotrichia bacterium]|nr:C69 family dipeptidase [Erysipelotrichia bacterium]